MRKLMAALAVTAGVGAAIAVAPPPGAQAYPGCYYSYRGCYLYPGWYDGRYWGGGPWWGWGSVTNGVMNEVNGCPVAWVDGRCPVR